MADKQRTVEWLRNHLSYVRRQSSQCESAGNLTAVKYWQKYRNGIEKELAKVKQQKEGQPESQPS